MPEPDRTSPCSALEYIQAADALLRSRVCALPGNDELLADALRHGQTVLGTAGIDGPGTGRPTAAPMRSTGGGDPLRSLRKYESATSIVAAAGAIP